MDKYFDIDLRQYYIDFNFSDYFNDEMNEDYYDEKYLHLDIDIVKSKTITFYDDQGRIHRDDGPAVIDIRNRHIEYYKNGVLHREGGPAIQQGIDRYVFYVNGVIHNVGAPAFMSNLSFKCYFNGNLHSYFADVKLPSTCDSGRKVCEFHKYGKYHNDDGYAYVDVPNGVYRYFLDGTYVTDELFFKRKANNRKFRISKMLR